MEAITCPGCHQAIRVPTDVLGLRAQCPFCKCHFRAPVRTPEGLTEPALIRRNPFAASRTFGPGLLLVFVGCLGLLTNARTVGQIYTDPELFAERTREIFEKANLPAVETTLRWMPVARLGCLALSALVVAGGTAMLRQRWHGLAMLGSVGALFNVADCCCVVGFPVGAWALFVLMNPTVRAEFSALRGPTTPPA